MLHASQPPRLPSNAYLFYEERAELLPMILVTGERMTGLKALPAINAMQIEPMEQQARGELVSNWPR